MAKESVYTSKLDSKGRISVPQEVRSWLGLSSGERVEFVLKNGRTFFRPSRSGANVFDKYCGILGKFPGGKKGMTAWLRQMRGR